MSIRNLDYIRSLDPKLYEAFLDVQTHADAIAQQTNGNKTGNPLPPPSIAGVNVTGTNGHFNIAIQDNGDIYRDVHYYVEHADNPHFTDPTTIHLGHTRNHSIFLGNVTRYFRAYSAYASSEAGAPAYHGSSTAPQPVRGGGPVGGPAFLPSEGSGTGPAGQGLSGPGPTPFRSKSGLPPIRGANDGPSGSGGSIATLGPATVGVEPGGAAVSGGGGGFGFPYIETTQSGLAAIAATLGSSNKGQPVYVTDYDHILYWTGTGWSFRNGDRSDYTQLFNDAPNPSIGWHLCDGSVGVSYLKSDGTLGTKTLPDLVGSPAYIKVSSGSTGTITPAVAPTLAMDSYTPSGTVSTPTFTGSLATTSADSAGTPAGTISTPTFSGGSTGFATTKFTTNAAGTAALISPTSITYSGTISTPTFSGSALGTHMHTVTPAGTISTPTFTGTAATLTGTISTTGEPQNVQLLPYFRL